MKTAWIVSSGSRNGAARLRSLSCKATKPSHRRSGLGVEPAPAPTVTGRSDEGRVCLRTLRLHPRGGLHAEDLAAFSNSAGSSRRRQGPRHVALLELSRE